MIPVPDLCIGNWVFDGDRTQFPMFIRAIGEDYVYLDFEGNEGDLLESKPEELQGIQKTIDILTKIGFRHVVGSRYGLYGDNFSIEVVYWSNNLIETEVRGLYPTVYDRCIHHKIYYLHELQNLFWNITKQQLNIKL